MPQIFGPRADQVFRFVLRGALVAALVGPAAAIVALRSDWVRGTERAVEQPVQFSHRHHVGEDGIDCRYCHADVERSDFAGIPATEVCMTCHSQLFVDAPMLAPVRESLATGVPIPWRRVHDLPDYVYFSHRAHVNNGVGCTTCHGEIDRMALTRQVAPLSMQWCLDCHRDPGPNLRRPDEIFSTAWEPATSDDDAELAELYQIHAGRMTGCYVCHR